MADTIVNKSSKRCLSSLTVFPRNHLKHFQECIINLKKCFEQIFHFQILIMNGHLYHTLCILFFDLLQPMVDLFQSE